MQHHCILRIPSLTNDSHVRADDSADMATDNPTLGTPSYGGACPPPHAARGCTAEETKPFPHQVHVGEALLSRCRQQQLASQSPPEDPTRGLRAGALWGGIDSLSVAFGSPALEPASGVKDLIQCNGHPQFTVQAGQVIFPSFTATDLSMDGICLRPICSRLPSRTTSICGEHDAVHADWAPCRIDSRHAEEALDHQSADACGSWMERVAHANGGGSLSISFFSAASRTHSEKKARRTAGQNMARQKTGLGGIESAGSEVAKAVSLHL
ncbi:uncharacterized protein LOC113147335 [Cyclospora cayetanensis]|uniref:Uncharacterized protein LOC113147335 n=1 Tax=Cyclospora cayetanensis TaxID=88456 RepID=A0A6P6RZQ6_9EIME|nr:uncharacterized protein LOC113147335 [Cyclospora cayetanensis]